MGTTRARRRLRLGTLAAAALAVVGATGPAAGAAGDQLTDEQWALDVIGARAVHGAGRLGAGVDVAVLDTGVHLGHLDFAGRIGASGNVVASGQPPQDDEGHGTHVAGIIAAGLGNGGTVGVAPAARIMPVKVLDAGGSGSSEGVAAAIRWAADNGAEVINLSLSSDTQFLFGPSTTEAVDYAWSRGVICVFAAGNNFVLGSGFADEPALVVSATTPQDTKAYFSDGVGAAQWGMAAPGGSASPVSPLEDLILSTYWVSDEQVDTYDYLEGTSMAAPMVAGAAAVLRGLGLGPQATVDTLLATARDLGSPGRDSTFGAGRLDLAAAVASATGAAPPPATTVPALPPEPTGAGGAGGGGGGTTPGRSTPAGATGSTTAGAPSTMPGSVPASGDDPAAGTAGQRSDSGTDLASGGGVVLEEPGPGSGRAGAALVAAASAAAAWAGLAATRRRRQPARG